MFRFVMPDITKSAKEREQYLKMQMEEFLRSDALAGVFDLLHTDRSSLAKDYNGRAGKDGRVIETQVMEPREDLENVRFELYPLLYELGFLHINKPRSDKYSRILVLGGALEVCFIRPQFAKPLITPFTTSVDGLACYRPIHPKERRDSDFSSPCDTEFGVLSDAFSRVFGLSQENAQDNFHGDRNLNRISCIRKFSELHDGCCFCVYAAPSSEASLRRADTGDTLRFYLEHAGIKEKDSLLAITSNRFCNRQFLQLAYDLLKQEIPLDLDVIGCIPDEELSTEKTYDPFQYLQDLIGILDWIGRFGL